MAAPMFIRFLNARHLSRINNVTVSASGTIQSLESVSRFYSTPRKKAPKIDTASLSKPMRAYFLRSKKFETFMASQRHEYEKGKRHLANMMGMDAESFTQEDIDKSLEYLFPSGLYDPRARPMMKHPDESFKNQMPAQFAMDGKPFHHFFYMKKPQYYEVLHNIVGHLKDLEDKEDNYIKSTGMFPSETKIDLISSEWLTKPESEKLLDEEITDENYDYLISTLQKLVNHPLAKQKEEFIMNYRKYHKKDLSKDEILPITYNEDGIGYVTMHPCQRKSAIARVTVSCPGSGKITINGNDIAYFHDMQSRQQVIFPLIFTDLVEKVDVEATVENGGPTGQSGAIRWGIAWCLRSFVTSEVIDNMKIAGLLTRDWRRRERKKFGQEGSRRKFTWKKR